MDRREVLWQIGRDVPSSNYGCFAVGCTFEIFYDAVDGSVRVFQIDGQVDLAETGKDDAVVGRRMNYGHFAVECTFQIF